jgi:glutaredoxin
MTPEMAFQCFLVSRDPAVLCTMDPILRDFSICTDVCPDSSKVANLLEQVSTDLLVIDLEAESSTELVRQVCESHMRQKPTILAVSATDRAVPGVHVVLRKPVTAESGLKSLKAAYSRMLEDFRTHTRFALMTSVLATDGNDRTHPVIVTNVGEGGVGLATKEKLAIGSILSFRMPLPGLKTEIHVQARILWTRGYGAAGCEFVRISPFDLQLLRGWLSSRYRIKKPLIPV